MTKKSGNGASVSARDNNTNKDGAETPDSVLHKLGVPAGLGTMRALEPRILLDAAALATFADAASDQAAMEASQWQREQNTDLPPAGEEASSNSSANHAEPLPSLPPIDENSLNDDFSLTDGPTTSGSNQIVFIDSAIDDIQPIIESIGDNVEIIIIDANSDGVEQIASVLESRENIDAIHIFSHGRSGTLDLGSTKLTEASIASRHADEMEIIRNSLSENADILLYGCDFGANARGVSAIDAFAKATGADVAASDDLTGAANLGGDWDLEVQAGEIEAVALEAAAFEGVLVDTDGDGEDDITDIDDDNDGILDVDEGFTQGGQNLLSNSSFELLNESAVTPDGDFFGGGFGEFGNDVADWDLVSGTADVYYLNGTQTVNGTPVPQFLITDVLPGDANPGPTDGTVYAAFHSGDGLADSPGDLDLARETIISNLPAELQAGTEYTFTIDAYQADDLTFGTGTGGIELYTIDTGATPNASTAYQDGTVVGGIASNAGATGINFVGISADVTADGTAASGTSANGTSGWQTISFTFTPTTNVDRIIFTPESGLNLYYAIDNLTLSATSSGTTTDTDGDGIADHLDLDSDNDGISDLEESGSAAGVAADTNSDGTISDAEALAAIPAGADQDNDGLQDIFDANTADTSSAASVGTVAVNTDGDSVADFLDLDSDNDGIADTVEARLTTGYTANDGDVTDNDADGDGVIDIFDSNDGTTGAFGGSFTAPVNTDGLADGADYIDTDADEDGLLDSVESGLTAGADANGDGIGDGINASYADPDGDVNDPINDLTNTDANASDVDYRSLNIVDTDGDGISDTDDIDDDNDGILDINEKALNFVEINDLYNVVGNASRISPTEVQLTPDANNQAGTIMSFNPISIADDFTFTYEIFLGDETSPLGGADGISFILHNDPAGSNAVGLAGGGIGATGIVDGIFVEFDTFNNSAFGAFNSDDIAGDHTQIRDTDSGFNDAAGAITAVTDLGQLEDSAWHNVSVSWDANTSTLSYLIDGVAMASYTDANIANTRFGGSDQVYFGFSASTGGATNDQRIRDIAFTGTFGDTDGDGVEDAKDRDSDNDGISDLIESGASAAVIAADTNNDGTISLAEAAAANGGVADADGDGLMDIFDADTSNTGALVSQGTTVVNTDGDSVADFIDLDSDNDGIADAVEAQPTTGYVTPAGPVDANGVNATGLFTPVNTDGTDTADYIDTDADNDGILDSVESGLTPGADANGDGIGDGINASYADPDGDVNDPSADLANQSGDTSEVGYRELLDADGDGIADVDDIDDDNDGILDTAEFTPGVGPRDGTFIRPSNSAGWPGATTSVVTEAGNMANQNRATHSFTLYPEGTTSADPNAIDLTAGDRWFGQPSGTVTFTWSTPVPANEIVIELEDFDRGPNVTASIVVNGGANPADFDLYTRDYLEAPGANLMGYDPNTGNITIPTVAGPSGNANIGGYLVGNSADLVTSITVTFSGTTDNDLVGISLFSLDVITPTAVDSDGEGVLNHLDLDSDNDGISDLVESGASAAVIAADTNNDGTISLAEAAAANGGVADADGDGLMDIFDANTADTSAAASVGTVAVNTDGDSVADYIDLDSDNDGIADTIEGRLTAGYVANDGDVTDNDADGDGVIDIFDSNDGTTGVFGGSFTTPVNTDGTDTADYIDTDADNDGILDSVESGLTPGADANGDGIGDGINASYADPDGDVNDPVNDLTNVIGNAAEADYREDNTPPVAVDDPLSVPSGGTGNVDVLGNDTDADVGDTLTVTNIIDPANAGVLIPITVGAPVTLANGTVVALLANGTLDVTPGPGSARAETFDYVVDDGNGGTDIGTVNMTVTNVAPVIDLNDTPFALPGSGTGIDEVPVITFGGPPDSQTNVGQTEVADGVGNGNTQVYLNVGTFNGQAFDMRVIAVEFVASGGGGTAGPLLAGNGSIGINAFGAFTVRYEIYEAGTANLLNINAAFQIGDIDASEQVEFDLSQISNYTIDGASALVASESGSILNIGSTLSGPGLPAQAIVIQYDNVSSFTQTFIKTGAGGNFQMRGSFVDPFGGTGQTVDLDHDCRTTFTEDGAPTPILHATGTISDIDDTNIESATVVLTNAQTDDVLNVGALPAGITAVVDTGTPGQITVTLTSDTADTISKADYEAALQAITFENTSDTPDTTQRNIEVTVNDGDLDSNTAILTIDVIPVNDDPDAVDDTGSTDEDTAISITAANGVIDPNDTDPESDPLTVTEVNGVPGDVGSQITLTSGALLTLNADGSYDYDPNGQFETLAAGASTTDTFSYTVDDGNGGTDTATVTITINGVNDVPVLNNDGDASSGAPAADFEDTYTENGPGIALVDSDSSVIDLDDDIVELVVVLTDGKIGDTINFPSSLPGNITAAAIPSTTLTADGTMTLTFTGDASTTTADWNSVLQSLVFLPSITDAHNPDPADRHFTFQVSDAQSANSNLTNTTIHVVPENDPPTLDLDDDNSSGLNAGNYQGTFTENAGAVPIHSNILISDLDDTNLQSAVVTLTNVMPSDEFVINGTAVGVGDTGTVNGIGYAVTTNLSGEILVTLTGDAPIADYDGALELIEFNNTSEDPDETQRVITVVINDGEDNSPTRMAFIDVVGVNDAPIVNIALADQSTTDGNTAFTMPTAGNFSDVDDTVLAYSLGAGAPPWLTINPTTGVISVSGAIPADGSQNTNIGGGAPGTYDVQVVVTDPDGLFANDVFQISITNLDPVAVDDTSSADEDITQLGNVITDATTGDADTPPDSDPLTVTAVTGGTVGAPQALTHGDLTLNSDGSWDFVPNAVANALPVGTTVTEVVTYTVDDGNGGTDTATLTIELVGTNDTPIIVDPNNPGVPPADPDNIIPDVVTTDGETPTTINVDDFIDDPDGDTLIFTQTGLPTGLSLDPNTGEITGTIDPDASQGGPGSDGIYDVVITGTDPSGATVTTTITYTITNLPPVAVDDTSSADEDITQLGNVITDATTGDADTPPDSDPLTVTAVTGGTVGAPQALTHGDLTLNSDGSWDFVPNAVANALPVGTTVTEVVTYTVDDGNGGTDTATLTIELVGTNDTPIIVDPNNPGVPPVDPDNIIPDVVTTDGETPTTINVDDFIDDPDGDTLIFTQTGLPTGLSLDPNTGEITGTIDPDASQGGPGSDGIYDVVITGTDPSGATVTTTITYTITNLPPVAVDDTSSADEDITQLGNVITDATTGDADTPPDSDPLTVTAVTGGTVGAPQALTHGDLTLNADGSWDFVPNAVANALPVGTTVTEVVTYTVDDGNGGTDTATLTIELVGTNDTPIIVDPNNPGVPPVDPDNIIPDVVTTDGETPTTINVDDFIDDPDGDTLIFTQTGLPTGLSLDPNTGEITGTIDPDASQGGPGSDGIYDVVITGTDPSGATVTTTITYTITNLPPVAVDDTSSADEDITQLGNVITDATTGDADTPPDSDPLTVTLADQGGNAITLGTPFTLTGGGELTLNADGSWDFDPGTSYNGLDDGETEVEIITYTVDDGNGGTDTATLTITVEGSNDAPVIIDPNNPGPDPENPIPADPATIIPVQQVDDGTDHSTTPLIDVSIYAADPDDEPLTFTTTDTLPLGLTLNPDGTLTGVVDPNASQGGDDPLGNPGVYTITVVVDDGTDTSTVTLVIDVNNPPPIAVDDAVIHPEDGISTGDVFANNGSGIDADTPPDTDPITVSAVATTVGAIPTTGNPSSVGVPIASPTGGEFTINADGTYSFNPGTDFQDLDVGESRDTSISYQISDGQGGFDTATVTVTVTGANDAPVITDPNDPSGNPNDPSTPADPNNIIPDVTGSDNQPITPLDVSDFFVDVDNEPLVFSLDPAGPSLPTWLSIDPVTGIITGTPPSDASQGGPANNGVYPIVVVATDPDGESVTTTIDFTILNVDPIVVIDLPDLSDIAGYTVTYPSFDSFSDPDGDELSFSATGLPTGLSVDPLTGVISGTIAGSAVSDAPNGDGIYTVTITVDDGQGGQVSATFIYNVSPLPFVASPNPSAPLPLFEIGGPFDPNIAVNSILTNVVNGIDSLGSDTALIDGSHPVTEAINQIAPLGAITRLGDTIHPISDLIEWIDQTRDLLNSTSSSEYVFLGGDATGAVGTNQIHIRSIVINQMVLLEVFGKGFSPKDWNIGIGQSNSTPGWAQNVDGRSIIILRPADLEKTILKLDGIHGDMSVKIDLVTGQLKIISSTNNLTQAPLFSEQIAAMQDQELQQVKALFNTG